ncbi:uncharacterized protein PG986_009946 [Apiospora aurea]|uniref:Uncharacterized protein n=1 Tax=Apiospora aurea TaxID=335848 RepID=A0ABR1Q9D6_9PEZI
MQISFLVTGLLAQVIVAKALVTPAPSLENREAFEKAKRLVIDTDPRLPYNQVVVPTYCIENKLCYIGCFAQIVPKGKCLGCQGCDPLPI